MRKLNLALGKNRRDICPDALEKLFAKGLTNTDVARCLKMSLSFLSQKIGNSVKLMQARARGQRSAAFCMLKNSTV